MLFNDSMNWNWTIFFFSYRNHIFLHSIIFSSLLDAFLVLKKINDLLIVYFKKRCLDSKRSIIFSFINLTENIPDDPRENSFLSHLHGGCVGAHGIGLATSSLSVSQYSSIVAFEAAYNQIFDALVINFLLSGWFLKDSVKFKTSLVSNDDLLLAWHINAASFVTKKLARNHRPTPDGNLDSISGIAMLTVVLLNFHV